MSVDSVIQKRRKNLEANINETLNLIKEYEDKRRLSCDPKEKMDCERQIVELRQLLDDYQVELKRLEVMGIQLQQMDTKLDTILEGQKTIPDNLVDMRKKILARFDANEQTIIATIADRLDEEQLVNTQAVLDSITTRQFEENELQDTLVAVRDSLNEIRQKETFLLDSSLTSEIENLSDVVDAPKLDASHKLKVTVPIIPFILSYEGEMGLKSGMNLESAWKKLLKRVRGKQ